MLQARGDAVISLVSDLQDPPELIKEFIKKWEEGFLVVIAVKEDSEESPLFFAIRKLYYELVSRLAEIELNKNATGFGLYDRRFIDILARDRRSLSLFSRPRFRDRFSRRRRFPITSRCASAASPATISTASTTWRCSASPTTPRCRCAWPPCSASPSPSSASASPSAISSSSCFTGTAFSLGLAPLEIGLFFFGSVQLFFIGILGEYIGAIHTQVQKRPHVVELERINFEPET